MEVGVTLILNSRAHYARANLNNNLQLVMLVGMRLFSL
jgi:hypothetical protein